MGTHLGRLAPLVLITAACSASSGAGHGDAATRAPDVEDAGPACTGGPGARGADILFVIDNSGSMRDNQVRLGTQLGTLLGQLLAEPAVSDLHVGVISTDLGTPGSTVPSCANSDVGDDGLLNPIRNGLAQRTHQPWTTAPTLRPARCTTNPMQYPNFLTFDATRTDHEVFREDFVCNAFLSSHACGLEQQLEATYRAVVLRDATDRAGNTDPNAGFLRHDAVLAIVMLTDEEDGSVRDCRYAERGQPCTDALGVFDSTQSHWATTDLNLRFYMYQPGTEQDPTWPLDRYAAVRDGRLDPTRGFALAKPGHPERIVFGAILGVPIELPMRGEDVDWDALLGRRPDGADAWAGMSPEGAISMRQAHMDPQCSTRVVPACRLQGSAYSPERPACDTTAQWFAWPSRRVAEVARRFAVTHGNGHVSSICRTDFAPALRAIGAMIQARRCP